MLVPLASSCTYAGLQQSHTPCWALFYVPEVTTEEDSMFLNLNGLFIKNSMYRDAATAAS